MVPALLSAGFQSLPPLPTMKLGPSSAWACACSRPLWVSLTSSPVRLGVSPAAASTPTDVVNQRFEALFPLCWSPGLRGLFCSPAICVCVWPCGVCQSPRWWVLSTPVPFSAPPTSLDECLFSISLVSDPLAVRFSVSSGCARRRSVSTYTSILAGSPLH